MVFSTTNEPAKYWLKTSPFSDTAGHNGVKTGGEGVGAAEVAVVDKVPAAVVAEEVARVVSEFTFDVAEIVEATFAVVLGVTELVIGDVVFKVEETCGVEVIETLTVDWKKF